MDSIEARKRITGETRTEVMGQIGAAYEAGEPIRSIAERLGRSYGFVHRMVAESGVTMRGRGGPNSGNAHRKAKRLTEAEQRAYAERLREGRIGRRR